MAVSIVSHQSQPSLAFRNNHFIIGGASEQKISILPGFQPMNTAAQQLWIPVGKRVVTYSEGKLGFRQNNHASYTHLSSLALSPQIHEQVAIEEINRDIAAGTKSMDFSAISGFEVVGEELYLLARWDTLDTHQPWLELLLKITFPQGKARTDFLHRFDGFTMAAGLVNDKLVLQGEDLHAVFVDGPELELGKYNIKTKKASAKVLQAKVDEAKLFEESRFGFTLTKTPAGTFLVGLINTDTASHTYQAEIRGSIFDAFKPCMLGYVQNDRKVLLNLMTGAQVDLPLDSGIVSASTGLLVWSPEKKPTEGVLYNFGGLKRLASWKKD